MSSLQGAYKFHRRLVSRIYRTQVPAGSSVQSDQKSRPVSVVLQTSEAATLTVFREMRINSFVLVAFEHLAATDPTRLMQLDRCSKLWSTHNIGATELVCLHYILARILNFGSGVLWLHMHDVPECHPFRSTPISQLQEKDNCVAFIHK